MSEPPRIRNRTRLPADIDMEDRLAWGLTARQLLILAATAVVSYAVFTLAGSLLPAPAAVVLAAPLALVGVALALGRRDGLSGERLAVAAIRHLAQSPRRVSAPERLPARLAQAPVQPTVSLLRAPVRAILTGGVIVLADGSCSLLLSASGASWELRSGEEQQALAEAYGDWLNSLTEPVAVTVRSEGADLSGHVSGIERAAGELAHPALADSARAHAEFLARLAGEGEGLRRRQIVLALSTRARDRQTARATLQRRAGEASELLGRAGVALALLDGEQAASLLFGALEPPGVPAGCHLDEVIGRC